MTRSIGHLQFFDFDFSAGAGTVIEQGNAEYIRAGKDFAVDIVQQNTWLVFVFAYQAKAKK